MIEFFTFAGALAFGSLAFWGVWTAILVSIFILSGLAEREHYFIATLMFVVAFVALATFGIFDIASYVWTNPWQFARYFGGYVLIGAAWSSFKWWRFCVKQRSLYEQAKADFLKANNSTTLTPALRVAWTERLKNQSRYDRHYVLYSEIPNYREHKEKMMNWLYLWPFSMVGFFISDFIVKILENIRDFFTWVWKKMGGLYDSIARAVWTGTENDLASEADIAAAKKSTTGHGF